MAYMVACSSAWRVSVAFFFFKQKTAYDMRISDWSSDVCSSDLSGRCRDAADGESRRLRRDRAAPARLAARRGGDQIGRASCRERVCQYVQISVVAVSLKKQIHYITGTNHITTPNHALTHSTTNVL